MEVGTSHPDTVAFACSVLQTPRIGNERRSGADESATLAVVTQKRTARRWPSTIGVLSLSPIRGKVALYPGTGLPEEGDYPNFSHRQSSWPAGVGKQAEAR